MKFPASLANEVINYASISRPICDRLTPKSKRAAVTEFFGLRLKPLRNL